MKSPRKSNLVIGKKTCWKEPLPLTKTLKTNQNHRESYEAVDSLRG